MCILVIIVFVGCNREQKREIWYVLHPEAASMVEYNRTTSTLSVFLFSPQLLGSYQDDLRKEHIASDEFGALQHLCGRQGDFFIRGDRGAWGAIGTFLDQYNQVEKKDLLSYVHVVIERANDLRNSSMIDTLELLKGPHTDVSHMIALLERLHRSKTNLVLFDIRGKISIEIEREMKEVWMQQWIDQALHYNRSKQT